MAAEASIRHAAEAQLDEIMEIERACFRDPWPRTAFLAEMAHEWSWFKIVGQAGPGSDLARIDGFIICWMLHRDMHLLNLAILPERRRQGLARALLEDAQAAFAAAGGGISSLEVRSSNRAARELYAAFGYIAVGVRKRYYRKDNEDAIVMVSDVEAQLTPKRGRSGGR